MILSNKPYTWHLSTVSLAITSMYTNQTTLAILRDGVLSDLSITISKFNVKWIASCKKTHETIITLTA
jgi:hypothetical protein